MPPLGECLRLIAPAAIMADKFVETTQNTVIGHGILAGKYLAEYRDSLK